MNLAHTLARPLSRPAPPPPGGFRDDLPEAFAGLDADGGVMVIGYQGEWYWTRKPSLRVRLHNWLVRVGNRRVNDGGAVDLPCGCGYNSAGVQCTVGIGCHEHALPRRRFSWANLGLAIAAVVLALVAVSCVAMAMYVLQEGEQPQATQGMFGFCVISVFAGFGAWGCGYRIRHGEWP